MAVQEKGPDPDELVKGVAGRVFFLRGSKHRFAPTALSQRAASANIFDMTVRFVTALMLVVSIAWPFEMSAAPPSGCMGDCDDDGVVSVNELVTAVGIGAGAQSLQLCPSADADSSGTVDVSELVRTVQQALEGCMSQDGALFEIRACASSEDPNGQTFHALIRDPAAIAEAEALVGKGHQQILSGRLLAGDGTFNEPWSWHLDPDTIDFSDFTIELCDGCPGFIEDELDYWLDVVGQYCPWSTEVVSRER